MERDIKIMQEELHKQNFNSHAHVERDHGSISIPLNISYFNSHAHVERDQSAIVKLDDLVISTHTLTWSVTFISQKFGKLD